MELASGCTASAAEALQQKARGAKIVKAFNTQFATHMDRGRRPAARRSDERLVVLNQPFNDSRRNRKDSCGIGVHIAPATAARRVVFSNRERTSRGLPYLTKQITPTVLSTMTPRHVSKWSSHPSGDRSRPGSM